MIDSYLPERIVCLTEESTELLYLLGEQDRIVGISGFTVRPKQARKEKPKISTFLDAQIDDIIALKPDLVIGFSDIQAGIAQQLISRGVSVWISNHRTIEETLKMMHSLGCLVGKSDQVAELISGIKANIKEIRTAASRYKERPGVYFEEWYDPLITGIAWVSELVEIAGGDDIFPEKRYESLAKNRIIADPQCVIDRDPDVIMASWCGKMFKKEKLLARQGWEKISAVRNDHIYEIDSSIILQPGPAALTDGLGIMKKLIERVAK